MTFHVGLDWLLLEKILFGLAIGGLIGLERERQRDHRLVLAGVRTHPLVALTGVLLAEIAQRTDLPLLIALGTAVSGGFALFLYHARTQQGQAGFTSPFALLVTYLIGVLVGFGLLLEAVVVGVTTTVLLFTRRRLHRVAGAMTEDEMRSALYFVVLAFILFPLAPNRAIDPWGVLNPRHALLIVILVSLIGFAAFLAMRAWGIPRGLPLSGLLGGLVNSEAATAAAAGIAREEPAVRTLAVRAILWATSTMTVRNLAIAAIADPSLRMARSLLVPLLLMGLVLAAWGLARRPPADEAAPRAIRLTSPFAIRPAVVFGALFVGIGALAFLLQQLPGLGAAAVTLTALGGLVSAGAVVASMAVLAASGAIPFAVAAPIAILATVLGILNKPVVARAAGHGLVRPLLAPCLVASAAGLAALAVVLAIPGSL